MGRPTGRATKIVWQRAVLTNDDRVWLRSTLQLSNGREYVIGPSKLKWGKRRKRRSTDEAIAQAQIGHRDAMRRMLHRIGYDPTLPDEEWGDYYSFSWGGYDY